MPTWAQIIALFGSVIGMGTLLLLILWLAAKTMEED